MLLNIYSYKNIITETFTRPIYDDHNEAFICTEVKKSIKFELYKESEVTSKKYGCLELYKIGVFDDCKGKMVECEPVLVLDCNKFVTELISKNEEDGTNEVVDS